MGYIICGKCGKRFPSVEDAKRHPQYCKGDDSKRVHFLHSSGKRITEQEWAELIKSLQPHMPPKPHTHITSPQDNLIIKSGLNWGKSNKYDKPTQKTPTPIKSKKVSNPNNILLKSLIRLCLNLAILTGLGILAWRGYHLFTHQVDVMYGSITLIIGIAIWITIIILSKSRSRHYWLRYKGTKPSFKLTTLSVIVIALIFAFAGVQPMALYKDTVTNKFTSWFSSFNITKDTEVPSAIEPIITEPIEEATIEESQKTSTSKVWIKGSYVMGIVLVNNSDAKNPTWNELVEFLRQDDTDRQKYDINSFVCADFAEMLHNNAEMAGWKCAYVSIKLTGYRDYANLGIPSDTGHALNAFETTDRGLVYIDCTNPTISSVLSADKFIDVVVGKPYIAISIFPSLGWESVWESMGTVTEIEVLQW